MIGIRRDRWSFGFGGETCIVRGLIAIDRPLVGPSPQQIPGFQGSRVSGLVEGSRVTAVGQADSSAQDLSKINDPLMRRSFPSGGCGSAVLRMGLG